MSSACIWGVVVIEEHDQSIVADTPLPIIGDDVSPTSEMIVRGHVGNGTRDKLTSELAKRIQAERQAMVAEAKAGRRAAYEEGMKDALMKVAGVQSGILDLGHRLLERLELGEDLTRVELDTLKLAQSAAKEIADRAIGKPKTTAEVRTQQSILHLIAGIDGSG